MSRKLKYILIVVVSVVVVLPLVVMLWLNSGHTKSTISAYVESRTGRVLSIDGRLGLDMALSATIYAEQVRLSNSAWARTPDMLSVGRLAISFSVAGLLRGEGLIDRIHVENPQLWIERHPQTGKFNVDLRKSGNSAKSINSANSVNSTSPANPITPASLVQSANHPDPANPGLAAGMLVDISQVSVGNGQVVYFDPRRDWAFEVADAVARIPAPDQPINLSLSGKLENTPVVLAGQMGSLRSVIERTGAAVELEGHLIGPENSLAISGAIRDILRWYGLDLQFEAFITDLSGLSGLAGVNLLPYRNVMASGKLVQPEFVGTSSIEAIRIFSSAYGLESNIEGRIGKLPRFGQMDLTFSAEGELDHRVFSEKWNEELVLNTSLNGLITGDRDDLSMIVNQGTIETNGMKLDLTGTVAHLLADWSSPLQVSLQLDDLSYLGDLLNRDLPSVPNVSLSGNIYRLDSTINIFDILLDNDSAEVSVLAAGSIRNAGSGQRGAIDFTVQAGTDFVGQFSDSGMAGLIQALNIAGTIDLAPEGISIPGITIDAAGQGIRIDGKGGVASIGNLETLQIDLEASVEGLDKLSDWVGQPLPETETIVFSGSLHGNHQQELTLGNIQVNLAGDAVSSVVSGEIRNLGKSQMFDLEFDFELEDAERIFALYPDLPIERLVTELLPARGEGQVRSVKIEDGGINHSVENLEVVFEADLKGGINGRFDHLFTEQWLAQASITIDGELDAGILPAVNTDLVGLQGYLDGSTEVSISKQGIAVDDIDASIVSGSSETRVAGKIESLSPFATPGLEVMIQRPHLEALLAEGAYPALARGNPVSGKLIFENLGQPLLTLVELKVGNSDLSGHVYLPVSREKQAESESTASRSIGKFTSQNMDLTELLEESGDSPYLFSRKPLRLPWLSDLDMEIQADFRRFKNDALLLDDVVSNTVVRNGRLSASIISESERAEDGERRDGALAIGLSLENRQSGRLKSRLTINGDDVDLASLAHAADINQEEHGAFAIKMDLQGTGRSVAEIMGSADGLILFRLNDATLENQGLKLFSEDLFLGLLSAINPLVKQDGVVDVECGVMHFEVNNGVASTSKGLALKTAEFTLLGSGSVDLSSENLDLIMSAKARKGLGVNASTIARAVTVQGRIRSPEIQPRTSGLLSSGLALGAAIVSGGWSLLAQGLFDRMTANSDVCGLAAESTAIEVSAVLSPKSST